MSKLQNIGDFVQSRVQAWNGKNKRSLAMIVSNQLEYPQNQQYIIVEHVFITEIDNAYGLLPDIIEEAGYSKYLVPCQLADAARLPL
ncbi:unnamed protein product [Strongylus vulgaris]|uniref:Uncharacterized protein n=1 Tax=Strongylus vulgaris TaxID=40348 RepID=A0A3P7JLR9_STRVU|nr:unnamed protein product [Strongylus vulgaris]